MEDVSEQKYGVRMAVRRLLHPFPQICVVLVTIRLPIGHHVKTLDPLLVTEVLLQLGQHNSLLFLIFAPPVRIADLADLI
jgi:hypothetical protein